MTLKEIRHFLNVLDMAPSKSLGQNFLFDQNLARWTVSQLDIQPGDHVVEIGPGLGALTDVLCEHDITLTLIEKDDRLIEHLRSRFNDPRITLHHTDALTFDTRQLLGRGPLRIIGNLPYYVSTPIIDRFADPLIGARRLTFTLQRELAERLNAPPRTKAYGAMTVAVGRRWQIQLLRTLPPTVFFPEPRVDSAVISMTPRPPGTIPICDEPLYHRLVRAGFSARRKQLQHHLAEFRPQWPAAAEHINASPTARAEELSIPQWTELTRFLAPTVAQRSDELFDVVDENDSVIDSLHRDEVHARDLRHRAVHILITNSSGELLLQKRSLWKDRNPGLWDSSAAGHVDAGESYEQAAFREVREELGIELPSLTPITKLGCSPATGFEFLQIYRASHDGPITPCPKELEGAIYLPIPQISSWLARSPQDFSPIFQQAFPLITSIPLRP